MPSYTIQAAADELSLGIGKRRKDDDDASVSLIDRTSTRASAETRDRPLSEISTNTEGNETVEPVSRSPLEPLPPYFPPPAPALVANESGRMRAPLITQTQSGAGNSRPSSRDS